MQFCCQVFDPRLCDSLIVLVTEFDCVGMSARFENNVILMIQTFVDVSGQAVEITKMRHGSYRAIKRVDRDTIRGIPDKELGV
jgi:hypothetical protein